MTAQGDGDRVAGADLVAQLRSILAQVTGREQAGLAPEAALFGDGAGLDSLTGTLLLVQVRHRFAVDVAAEDLNLDCLASLAALAAFIGARLPAATAR